MSKNVIGLDRLIVKLDKLSNANREEFLNAAAAMVERDAKALCPVGDGELRNSITTEVTEDSAAIGTNLEYAPYVHQGTGIYAVNGDGRKDVPWVYRDKYGVFHSTVGQPPQPFLTEALDYNRDNILSLLKLKIRESVK